VQKALARLYDNQSATPPADTRAVLAALLPHIDQLSRDSRSVGLVFIRQLVLLADRLADDPLHDTVIFSAARSLEAMPIDRHASRFFDSPMSNLLALLRGLRRAPPEQAELFLHTLDLCLTRDEQRRLPGQLEAEFRALPDPPDAAFQRQGERFYPACMLHALAPHVGTEHAAALAIRLAETFGVAVPASALESAAALESFACRLVLASVFFHRPEVTRNGRMPAHRYLNLHDVGGAGAAFAAGRCRSGEGQADAGHSRRVQPPARRRDAADEAGGAGLGGGAGVQERGGADLWLFGQAGQQLPGVAVLA